MLVSGLGFLTYNSEPAEQPLGATLYVGPSSTYKIIQDAINVSNPGDTIIVDNATYNENLTILTNNITLIGNSSVDTKLQAGSNVGIYINANWVNVSGFNITTTGGTNSFGIYLDSANNCTIEDTTIYTDGSSGHCIRLLAASNNNLINNNLDTIGSNARGIYLSFSSDKNRVLNNHIDINETAKNGIYQWSCSDNRIIDNTINTLNYTQSIQYGIYLGQTSDCTFDNNTINTLGPSGHGFLITQASNDNKLINNTINTKGGAAFGISLNFNIWNNNIIDNTINTSGANSRGIHVDGNSKYNDITNNLINTSDNFAYGIYIYQSPSNYLIDNTIHTTNLQARGIYLEDNSKRNELNGNTIITDGDAAFGIFLDDSSSGNNLTSNAINTSGSSSNGIHITQFSHFTNVTENTISTLGGSGYGISIDSSDYTLITNSTITTFGITSPGVYLDGLVATVVNSSITANDPVSNELVAINDGNLTAINTSFTKVFSTTGVVQVKNYLHFQVYFNDHTTPIPSADVKITDNDVTIYSTVGYSGSDAGTSTKGKLENIVITDRWYFYSNTPTENITNVSVKKTWDASWEEVRNLIDMNTSHTEYFFSTDITAPQIPTGLRGFQIGPNALNLSWDQMPDTYNYTLYRPSCQVAFFRNITFPQNWTLHTNLPDDTWYDYAIQAWDAVGLSSGLSQIEQFFVKDITPPGIPTGLTVTPVVDGDAFNITWDLNNDNGDTINYELWFEDPDLIDLVVIANISHPQNWFVFQNDILKDLFNYNFKIQAWDKVNLMSGLSPTSVGLHQDYIAPAAPTGLIAVGKSTSLINLSWLPSSDIDVVNYMIYINQTGGGKNGPFESIGMTSGLSFDVNNLAEFTKYYFVIEALDEANNPSGFSNEANATTIGIEPGIPKLDPLPEYTNNLKINITGISENFSTVIIINNNVEVATGPANKSGHFSIEITLEEDSNNIRAKARDLAGLVGEPSEAMQVILDTEKPVADAGLDVQIDEGTKIIFSASESTDNYEIDEYTWEFENKTGTTVLLSGETPEYTFNNSGNFEITLTVIDKAGNPASDTLWINVTKLVIIRPEVKNAFPLNNSKDVPINKTVTIIFTIPMDKDSVESELKIEPSVIYVISWTGDDNEFNIIFPNKLAYGTNYTITIGPTMGATGGILEDAPFILKFTTKKESVSSTITITSLSSTTKLKAGETIIISGTTTGLQEGDQITVSLGEISEKGTISNDGSWSVSITLPEKGGQFTIYVSAGEASQTIPITLEKEDEPDDEDEDKGIIGFGPAMDLAIILLIIIIIVIIILALLLRKKKPEEDIEEKDDEELEEETEE
jgi:parallel beta-helix repeat protein